MKILVTSPETFTGSNLTVGAYYNVEPACEGTEAQNRTFHPLVQEYWRSGCHNYPAKSYLEFREYIKLYLGAGTEEYMRLVDEYGKPLEKPVVDIRIKSWSDYTKKERRKTIDLLISEMLQAGVQTKEFYEILDQLEKNSMEKVAR
jgi:hypothetical protein